jgi:hypothetical protein
VSAWDTPQDATEFYEAYISLLPEKIKDVSLINHSKKTQDGLQKMETFMLYQKRKSYLYSRKYTEKLFNQTFSLILETYFDFEASEQLKMNT